MKSGIMNNSLSRHLQDNLWLYVVCLLCLFTGIVLGIYTVKYMGDMERQDLINYFIGFKDNIKTINPDHTLILFETLKNTIPTIIIIWILGLTVVGIPVILILDLIKGFTLGFSLTLVFNSLGVGGLWFTVVGLLPQNIIYIPCIIIGSVLAMQLSLTKLRNKVNKQLYYSKGYFINYSISFIIIVLCMILGVLYEVYITPNAIKAIAMLTGSMIC